MKRPVIGSWITIILGAIYFLVPLIATFEFSLRMKRGEYSFEAYRVVFGDPNAIPEAERTAHPELAAPAHVVETSNRRWRDDEFLIPRHLTEGRQRIRVRVEHRPVGLPLFRGHPRAEEAWTEFRYWAYCFVMPRTQGE